MKPIVLIASILLWLRFFNVFGQNPGYMCFEYISPEDSTECAIGRYEGSIPRITSDMAPKIDGILDSIWYCGSSRDSLNIFRKIPAEKEETYFPKIYMLYDSLWLYLAINVIGDDDLLTDEDKFLDNDHVQIFFQNTWGGRRDSVANHCDIEGWWNLYWDQDGDLKWKVPINKSKFLLLYDDFNINDGCYLPFPSSFGVSGPSWESLKNNNQILFETKTKALSDNSYRIVYELAINFRNWMKFNDTSNIPLEGHEFGLEISVRDRDSDYTDDRYELSKPNEAEWCTPSALAKLTLGPLLGKNQACAPPLEFCEIDPTICNPNYGTNINQQISHNIKIFPNPATEQLNIVCDKKITTVEIVNLMGQVVLREENFEKGVTISGLKSSVYVVRVYSDTQLIANERVIVY